MSLKETLRVMVVDDQAVMRILIVGNLRKLGVGVQVHYVPTYRFSSFYGTGTVTLSGTHSFAVVGTGAYPARRSYAFTPTAGTLTLTVTGTVQFANRHYAPNAELMKRLYIDLLSDRVERNDSVAAIYRKSLLYFVSNALEVDLRTPILGAALNPQQYWSTGNYALTTKSKALFGQLDWQATETLKVTAGLRYTKDEREGALTTVQNKAVNFPFTFENSRFDPMVTLAFGIVVEKLVTEWTDVFGGASGLFGCGDAGGTRGRSVPCRQTAGRRVIGADCRGDRAPRRQAGFRDLRRGG